MLKILTIDDFLPANAGNTLSDIIFKTYTTSFALGSFGSVPPPYFHAFASANGYDLEVKSQYIGEGYNEGWKITATPKTGVYSVEEVIKITKPMRNQISDLSIGNTIDVAYSDPSTNNELSKDNADLHFKKVKYGRWLINDFEDYEFLGVRFSA